MSAVDTTVLHAYTLNQLEQRIARVRDAHGAALGKDDAAYALLTDHYRDLQAVRADLLQLIQIAQDQERVRMVYPPVERTPHTVHRGEGRYETYPCGDDCGFCKSWPRPCPTCDCPPDKPGQILTPPDPHYRVWVTCAHPHHEAQS